ncbi:MAG: S41 family peptidase [Erythrobacter sp.]
MIDQAALSRSAPGIWKSDGYGYILDNADAPKVYNVVGDFCQLIEVDQESPLIYFDRFRLDRNERRLFLSSFTEPHEIGFDRIGDLPDSCLAPAATDALSIFDVFAETYAKHYAFFGTHGVEWTQATAEARARLTFDSSEQELVETFIGLLSQLKDGHVSISATVDGDEGQFIAYPGRTNEAIQRTHSGEGSAMAAFGRQYLRRDIEDAILGGQGIDFPNERIKYGITGGDIGYMAVMSEGGFASGKNGKDASPEEELAALEPALDQAMAFFNENSVQAVIIDLSVNSGGYDYLGRAVAARFAKDRTFVYSKFAYDAQNKSPTRIYIEPSSGERFVGPVYVLTSDMTVSAGESLAMSLRALPHVTHAGEATRGSLSDVLVKYLPNGWEITLSNEVYTDHAGDEWEGKGIEPQLPIQVFDPDIPLTGHVDAVEALIKAIRTG